MDRRSPDRERREDDRDAGILLLPAIAIGLLLVSYYRIDGRARRVAA